MFSIPMRLGMRRSRWPGLVMEVLDPSWTLDPIGKTSYNRLNMLPSSSSAVSCTIGPIHTLPKISSICRQIRYQDDHHESLISYTAPCKDKFSSLPAAAAPEASYPSLPNLRTVSNHEIVMYLQVSCHFPPQLSVCLL